MDGNTIIRSERAKNGVIIHHAMPPFPPISEQETYFSRAVRCGISWPMPEKKVPGYFCVFGEEWDPQFEYEGHRTARGKLRFLAEYVYPSLSFARSSERIPPAYTATISMQRVMRILQRSSLSSPSTCRVSIKGDTFRKHPTGRSQGWLSVSCRTGRNGHSWTYLKMRFFTAS
jgi:hypothetical protein